MNNLEATFDWERALERNLGDRELTMHVIDLFCKLMPRDVELYKMYIKTGNADKLILMAHKIKSRLAFLNCDSLASVFEEIEHTSENDRSILMESEVLLSSYLLSVLKYKNDNFDR